MHTLLFKQKYLVSMVHPFIWQEPDITCSYSNNKHFNLRCKSNLISFPFQLWYNSILGTKSVNNHKSQSLNRMSVKKKIQLTFTFSLHHIFISTFISTSGFSKKKHLPEWEQICKCSKHSTRKSCHLMQSHGKCPDQWSCPCWDSQIPTPCPRRQWRT